MEVCYPVGERGRPQKAEEENVVFRKMERPWLEGSHGIYMED